MSEFMERISKLSPQRLALLAAELNDRLEAAGQRQKAPLAIVGIGCRLPGGVSGPEGFWELLRDGVDAVSEIPRSRWNVEEFYDQTPDTPGRMTTRWGGLIDGPDQFDPKFFGIAPAEAASMDPQQRLLLETAWESLEHAGIAPDRLADSKTGVFVGICNGDYAHLAMNQPPEKITPYFALGLSHAVAAGRISYLLGLEGPSLAVDTSCSASLVAVHLACQSLRLGECDMALAGGVNLILNEEVTIALSQSRMMAPDGRCKAFSDAANGFVRSEGAGLVVLKRLPDALRHRNRILAVIRGSACNQDGRSSGLAAPNGPSQEAVILAALENGGLSPDDIDVVEAHGTGTALGDPIEAGALNAVFGRRSVQSDPLYVGSVKTNLGHLESAAGIAGLIKLVLAMEHGEIPASLHLGQPSRHIDWKRFPLRVPTERTVWKRRGAKRVGGVSSFGFSGTNAHVVVEEFRQAEPSSIIQDRPYLFRLSAKTPAALTHIAARLRDHLRVHPELPLDGVARTLHEGRSHFEFRAAFSAASHGELLQRLDRFQSGDDRNSVVSGRIASRSPRIAFIFDGSSFASGDRCWRELYEGVPAFRDALDRCDGVFRAESGESVTSTLYPEFRHASEVEVDRDGSKLSRPWQTGADFSLCYAFAELWRSCGVEPASVSGAGVGEFVAACLAGVLSLEEGARLALAYGRKDPEEFARHIRGATLREPQIPFTSYRLDTGADAAESWLRRFAPSLRASAATQGAGNDIVACLSIGSRMELRGVVEANGREIPKSPLAGPGDDPRDSRRFLDIAAALYGLGCNPDLERLYGESTAELVALPTYPFERERYWLEDSASGEAGTSSTAAEVPAGQVEQTSAQSDEDWVYDLVWEPKPLLWPAAAESRVKLDREWLARVATVPATPELTRVDRMLAALRPVYSTIILEALEQMGWHGPSQADFTVEELAGQLCVIPARRRVLRRFMEMLVEDDFAACTGERFRLAAGKAHVSADEEIERLIHEHPERFAELNLLRRCVKNLAAVLQGKCDPMQLVFASGSIQEAEAIYRDSPVCRYFNDRTATAIRSAVESLDRRARILEIGAGTGATTESVVSSLRQASADLEYVFTDVSPVFLSRAREKFRTAEWMDYRLLDIERDPIGQGYTEGAYDVILAANVLHATRDLRQTLAHARSLLAPSGLLLLIEGVRPDRWLELTFGLTDGWWRFTDFDLRPKSPIVSAETWAQLLREVGMSFSQTISYRSEDGNSSQQIVIVGQVDPAVESALAPVNTLTNLREWWILADRGGVGETLAKVLVKQNRLAHLVRRPEAAEEIPRVLAQLSRRADAHSEMGGRGLGVVYLWGLDAQEPTNANTPPVAGVDLCGKTLVRTIQAVLADKERSELWIVTQGAHCIGPDAPMIGNTVQSLAWGIGRTLRLEAPEHLGALIDLDPAIGREEAAGILARELLANEASLQKPEAGHGEVQIAYRDGQRLAARLRRAHLSRSTENAVALHGLRPDGSYLLVGGLGGIGLRVARWAARQRAGHLVLLGKTGTGASAGSFAQERLHAIEEIRALGSAVTVVEGDVGSGEDMQTLFARFGGELPPLRGIIHAATEVHIAPLHELTDAAMDAMFRAKVAGVWHLHELTKNRALDFFLVFSSITSLLGARGMAHYSAANEFANAFAGFRRASGLPMLSVDWGAWDVMRLVQDGKQDSLREVGLNPMPSEQALAFLGDLTASDRAQIAVASVNWRLLKPLFERSRAGGLLEHMHSEWTVPEPDVRFAPGHASLHTTLEMVPEARKRYLEKFVSAHAARVLGLRHGELPPLDVPLTDLGLDSLMAVDLKNSLQMGLGRTLSPTVVFDYPRISDMVELMETMLWAAGGGSGIDSGRPLEEEIHL